MSSASQNLQNSASLATASRIPPESNAGAETAPVHHKTSPLKGGIASRQQFSATNPTGENLDRNRKDLAGDMENHLAEVTDEEFLRMFVPGDDPTPEEQQKFLSFDAEKLKLAEPDMGREVIRVSKSILGSHEGNDLEARDTSYWPDPTDTKGKKRPDVVIYPKGGQASQEYTLTEKNSKDKKKGKTTLADDDSNGGDKAANFDADQGGAPVTLQDQDQHLARVRWAWMCVPIELKSKSSRSAFPLGQQIFCNGGDESRAARGQLADYAARILRRQHRTFCFMITVTRTEARLLRWDRAGAVVTNSFDLTDADKARPLYIFLYRLSKMTPEERGYDPTVVPATDEEKELMRDCKDALPEGDYRRKRLEVAMKPGWPIYKVMIPQKAVVSVNAWRAVGEAKAAASASTGPPATGETSVPPPFYSKHTSPPSEDKNYRCFLIAGDDFSSDSPIGRGTRGYIAYDMETRRFVYLKDAWRAASSNSEIKTYQQLHENLVCFIATPICGGDVIESDDNLQQTRTQEVLSTISRHIHCRLVVEEIGIPIFDYPTGRNLVAVMLDTLLAHEAAWERANVMHRDISAANLLMLPDPESTDEIIMSGLLIDWDLAKFRHQLEKGSIDTRSGTWQFKSALLLRRPGMKQHEVSDDLESFMHVLTWLCLRFHKHDNSQGLQDYVTSLYDLASRNPKTKLMEGGQMKMKFISEGVSFVDLSERSLLKTLVCTLALLCKQHYAAIDLTGYLDKGADAIDVRHLRKERRRVGYRKDVKAVDIFRLRPEDTASKSAQLYLSTHEHFLNAFSDAVDMEGYFPEKVEDQFKAFEKSSAGDHVVRSSLPLESTGSKRASTAKKRRTLSRKKGKKLCTTKKRLSAVVEDRRLRDVLAPTAEGSQAAREGTVATEEDIESGDVGYDATSEDSGDEDYDDPNDKSYVPGRRIQ
ncbi:hypothetical protein IEO21_10176 [Rhodonia placenta]|uniref:Fungal-type protein kinase domain-containing protein n=1 Tax=Rhodonia placenta TaxID=104341 RepID=A0A8H7TXT0_9APHY|nr:hypothetical protein IEO21_10176 [Postia placenta]